MWNVQQSIPHKKYRGKVKITSYLFFYINELLTSHSYQDIKSFHIACPEDRKSFHRDPFSSVREHKKTPHISRQPNRKKLHLCSSLCRKFFHIRLVVHNLAAYTAEIFHDEVIYIIYFQ